MPLLDRARYPLAVVGLVLTAFLLRGTASRLLTSSVRTGFPVWLPTFGTVGQTLLVYQWALTAFGFLFIPAAAFWLGVRYERDAVSSASTMER